MLARACGSAVRPAGVSRTLRGNRSSSGPPSSRSRAWIWCESPGWLTCNTSAARVNEPSSTTVTKYSSWRSEMVMHGFYRVKRNDSLDRWSGWPHDGTMIMLNNATKAIEAGKDKAAQLGIAFTITIVDAGGHLVALCRMDGAALGSVEASQSKARTSVMFATPTRDLAGAVQPGAPMFGIDSGFRDPLAFV